MFEVKKIELHGDNYPYEIVVYDDFTYTTYKEEGRQFEVIDRTTWPTGDAKEIAEAILKLSKEK